MADIEISLRLPEPIAAVARGVGNDCVVSALKQALNHYEAEACAGKKDVQCFALLLENCLLYDAAQDYLDARNWLQQINREDLKP